MPTLEDEGMLSLASLDYCCGVVWVSRLTTHGLSSLAGALFCILSKPRQLSLHFYLFIILHVIFLHVRLKGGGDVKLIEVHDCRVIGQSEISLHVQQSYHSLMWRQARGICLFMYLHVCLYMYPYIVYLCTHTHTHAHTLMHTHSHSHTSTSHCTHYLWSSLIWIKSDLL